MITKITLVYNPKGKFYSVQIESKEGKWSNLISVDKVYQVGNYLVYQNGGKGIPIKVFKDKTEMVSTLSQEFGLKVDTL